MNANQLCQVLLIEVQRLIKESSHGATDKLGIPVAQEAIEGYLTEEEMKELSSGTKQDISSSLMQKAMQASIASTRVLSYPLNGTISREDAIAIESLKLTPNQVAVVERLIGESITHAFFSFFCLLDSVADPEVTKVEDWSGADFVSPREEGPMLHDELHEAHYQFIRLTNK
jgi:hypothetical protein